MNIFNKMIGLFLRFVPCAFAAADMNRLQAGSVTLWTYKTSVDTIIQIVASGYFNSWTNHLRQGDIILAVDTGTGMTSVTVSSADNAATVTVVKTS